MLAVTNINKSFYHNPVLNNLSFGVNDGDVIALTGKNGAGKSTLLRILARISQPDGGTVFYNDDIFFYWEGTMNSARKLYIFNS